MKLCPRSIRLQFEPNRNGYYCWALWIHEQNRMYLWERYVDRQSAEEAAKSVQHSVYPSFDIVESSSYKKAKKVLCA